MNNKNVTPPRAKRVFLADHFSVMRLAVANWLRQTPDLFVCGQADDAASALELVPKSKPDILLTEIFCPGDFQLVQELHKKMPRLPILVFSDGNEKWHAPPDSEARADGCVLKGVNAEGLIDAIRRTLEGRVVLGPNMQYQLLVKCTPPKKPSRMQNAWGTPPARRKLPISSRTGPIGTLLRAKHEERYKLSFGVESCECN